MKKRILAGILSLVMFAGQWQGAYAVDDAEFSVCEDAPSEEGENEELPEYVPAEAPAEIAAAGAGEKYLRYGLIVADPVVIGGKSYHFTAELSYMSRTAYLGRKIKAADELQASITSTTLDELVKDVTGQPEAEGLIEWKFTEKKNVKCGSDAYFTVKAAVNKKVAKNIGCKGKNLSNLKKGVSKFNKASKSVRMYFTISNDPGAEEEPVIKPVKINAKNFPDKNFRKVISGRAYDRDGNGTLDEEEIAYTINIHCEGKNIKSLKGVEHFTALQGLWCMDNKIKTVDLRNNKELRGLWCSENLFTSLDLSENTELLWVYCYECRLKNLNVANNPKLAFIECNTNPLTLLDVSRNPELEHLTCGSCELTELDLSNNPKLAHLDAFRNHFSTLDVSHNPKMKRLDIWDNPGLGSIDLGNNPELQYYNCANNDAESLDVSRNPELQKLICSYNDITALDISGNPKLVYLDCACNEIGTLDLSANHYLYFLQAFTNPFTSLDIGNNPFLIKTYNEGVKKDESAVCKGHSWTIDYGGDTSTGGDNIYFLCFDDAVTLKSEPAYSLPESPYPDDDEPLTAEQITREQAVLYLYEKAGRPDVSGLKSRFKDVEAGSEYEAALLWGEANSICMGYPYVSSEDFGVGRCLRRQDLAFMLMRYAEYAGYDRAIDFGRSDDFLDYFDIDYYAWEAVCWAITQHIMSGDAGEDVPKDQQYFKPHAKATKAELEAAFRRMAGAE